MEPPTNGQPGSILCQNLLHLEHKRERSEKVKSRSSSYYTESFIIWKYTPGEMRQVWLQKTQNCFEQEQDFLLFHLVLHCLKSGVFFAKAQYMCSNISSPFCRDVLIQSFCKDTLVYIFNITIQRKQLKPPSIFLCPSLGYQVIYKGYTSII